ncbi:cation transporter [Ruficoccus amylovorans]|uniref:Cation transporter n=1 Tax=Ruficoccus amylovorans TaxID=1804625 RepID=A0A842H9U0_9BACT|nr:cation diffusion facilitator family transporter [Ruficoccus amylovorans]MBC2593263.1 cation transporter [Ruficoccus amylovorans]
MEKKQEGLRITWLSVWMNISLGALKCVVGFFAHSSALIADGLHSLVDLSTDVVALFGLKMAAKPRDDNHPYGHHRFSSLCSLFIGLALLGFCAGLIISSVHELIDGDATDPTWPALAAAAASLAAKEWLFLRTRSIARREKSRLLMANALHHRTDSLSSALVLVALIAILIAGPQLAFLDKLVGIILGGWLGVEAVKIIAQTCNDLLDAAPSREVINDIREHILPVPGAVGYHQFRARRVGDMIDVDLHLQVNGSLSVDEGHEIARRVRENILSRHSEVIDVLIHVEPDSEEHLRQYGVSDLDQSDKPVP